MTRPMVKGVALASMEEVEQFIDAIDGLRWPLRVYIVVTPPRRFTAKFGKVSRSKERRTLMIHAEIDTQTSEVVETDGAHTALSAYSSEALGYF